MWVAERFPSLELLLDFLNDRAIRAERCKVVVDAGSEGGGRWHLLYQPEEDGGARLTAVAAVEAEAPEGDEAVASAEAIIADAQRDE